jgi:DNA-binding protein H-NS
MSNQSTPSDSRPHGKNGATKPHADDLPDLSSATSITHTEGPSVMARGAPLPIDLAPLSDEVLDALINGARTELEARKLTRETEFFRFVDEQAKVLGVSAKRLAAVLQRKAGAAHPESAVDGRTNPKPVYWNPKDHSQRWTKKGNRPRWFQDCLDEGITEEQMLIPEGAL